MPTGPGQPAGGVNVGTPLTPGNAMVGLPAANLGTATFEHG